MHYLSSSDSLICDLCSCFKCSSYLVALLNHLRLLLFSCLRQRPVSKPWVAPKPKRPPVYANVKTGLLDAMQQLDMTRPDALDWLPRSDSLKLSTESPGDSCLLCSNFQLQEGMRRIGLCAAARPLLHFLRSEEGLSFNISVYVLETQVPNLRPMMVRNRSSSRVRQRLETTHKQLLKWKEAALKVLPKFRSKWPTACTAASWWGLGHVQRQRLTSVTSCLQRECERRSEFLSE